MKSILIYIFLAASVLSMLGTGRIMADSTGGEGIAAPDSVPALLFPDSAAADSTADSAYVLPATSLAAAPAKPGRVRYVKADLDAPVEFSADDSMLIKRRDSAYMYGKSKVSYGEIKLDAARIELDLNDNTVYAVGVPDSTGAIQGKPVFSQAETDYEAATMRYNFSSEKGFITNVVTQQGEGYLTGGTTKKDTDGEFYIRDGFYTTCDHHDHPHFGFHLTKAKVRPGKDVVTGPAYMVLAGLPLPLAVPFGYFPFSEKYASGIIVPSFGDDYNRGFYLNNGGYYFAISDNIDLALTGEVYTKGSWGVNAQSTYARRYKYNGSFSLNFLKTILGDKGSPDYSQQTNFQVLWSHSQDSKANPNMSLSASVNFTTSGYSRNDLGSYYSPSFTENTKSSTINMTYRFPNSKWNLSTTFNVSQRTQDSTLTVSFPNVTVSLSQVYPFKRKKAIGAQRWYEKIKLSYTGLLQNSLTSKQNVFFKKSLVKDWRNGMSHRLPISATFNVLNYINITPGININDRMYTTRVNRSWDSERNIELMDTTYGFYNVYDFSGSVSVDTKIYGFFQPLGFLGKKVKMIRHVLTPSVSFGGSPDFASPFFGFYGSYAYTDSRGQEQIRRYSKFPSALFGVPGQGASGSVSVSLSNNLEMKVKTDNDSIEEKKISLIENLNIQQSYNLAADSLRWSDIGTSILLRLSRSFNLSLSATWDPYTYQLNASGTPVKVNRTRLQAGKGWGRLMRTGTSFSYTFNNDTFRRKNSNNNSNSSGNSGNNTADSGAARQRDADDKAGGDGPEMRDGYAAWSVPWSLTLNYSVNYGYGAFNKEKMEFDGKITQNLSFNGNIKPTPGWSFSFSASYNFDTKKIAYMNCNIARDLHCFSMSASFVPLGPYKSYNFHIAVKSSMLSDLKYDKRSSYSNGIQWY